MAAALSGLGNGVVVEVVVVRRAVIPPVLNLVHAYNPELCVAVERSSSNPSFGSLRLVFKPAKKTDPSQQFEPVLHDADGSFELFSRHSGSTINIGHIQPLLLDPSYFHPRAVSYPARWKAAVVKNATGHEVAAGIVCASALHSETLMFKSHKAVVVQAEIDDAAAGALTSTTRASRRLFHCFYS